MRGIYIVQMVIENYDILQNPIVRTKYPTLYEEVKKHDEISSSSEYNLSEKAYMEYQKFSEDIDINYAEQEDN